jgi:hypothetical protein
MKRLTGITSNAIGRTQAAKIPSPAPSQRKRGRARTLSNPKRPFSTGTQLAWRVAVRTASWSAKTPHSTRARTKPIWRAVLSPRKASSFEVVGATSTKVAPTTRAKSPEAL